MNEQPRTTCQEVPLPALLRADEASDEFRLAAKHVETCENCQQRLDRLAADEDSWSEARELLGSRSRLSETTMAARQGAHFAVDDEYGSAISRRDLVELLDAPSHPEMLGRLGRYEIECVIGAGGMGIVLKAHDSQLNRPVAVKVLAPHLAHSAAARQRFAREGRAAAAVVHEHVIAIHNVDSDARRPFLVMQYIPGDSLQQRVRRHGPLEVKEILRIGMQTAAGLAAAHAQGVVHRDVKPSNILLENSVERAVLTDFGLARAADDASLTASGILTGTPHYMSPEQAQGDPIDHRSDLFSLGAVLYFMATGHPPFRAEGTMAVLQRICRDRPRPLWEINPDLPDTLCDVIQRLLAKKPSARYATATEVGQELSRLLARAQEPRRFRRFAPWRRRLRRHPVAVAAAAIFAVVGVMAAIVISGGLISRGTVSHSGAPLSNANSDADTRLDVLTSAQQRLAAEMVRQGAFATDAAEILTELSRIETQTSSGQRFFLPAGSDEWTAELSAIQNELTRVETYFQNDPQPPGEEK